MKLYICGNGFDLHYGYKTRFTDYKEFLLEHYLYSFSNFEEFRYLDLSLSDKWSDLEQSLTINYEECIEDAINEFYPDLNDDSDSRWYAIDIDLEEQTKFIYDFTGKYFIEWLNQIDFNNTNKKLNLDNSSLYLTFNYTSTLEKLYNISPNNIYHIHGSLDSVENMLDWVIPSFKTIEDAEVAEQPQVDEINNDICREQIQFGSISNDAQKIKLELQKRFSYYDFFSVSIEPAIEHIIGFCDAASKNIKKNYKTLRDFISGKNINEVIIMGHSIMGVDFPYYSDVIIPVLKDCCWKFYCFSDDDRKNTFKFIQRFSLNNFCIKEW